jgi:hypothetical protein
MTDRAQDLLQQRLVAALDDRAANLDAETLARLAAARRAALATRRRTLGLATRRWQAVGGLVLAASVVFGVSIWLHGPVRGPMPPSPADLELLAEDKELELLEKLEFFRWLETEAPQVAEKGGNA